jgi:hypothetical protein
MKATGVKNTYIKSTVRCEDIPPGPTISRTIYMRQGNCPVCYTGFYYINACGTEVWIGGLSFTSVYGERSYVLDIPTNVVIIVYAAANSTCGTVWDGGGIPVGFTDTKGYVSPTMRLQCTDITKSNPTISFRLTDDC